MKKINLSAIALSGLLLGGLGGCAIANDVQLEEHRYISIGQELLDLKKSRDEGAISDSEFIELKSKLIERHTSNKFKEVKEMAD